MKRWSITHLALAVATVFGASWLAYAELGGAGGVMIPFQGTLHDGGAAVNTEVTLTFEVWTAASDGSRCLEQPRTFTPANGAFAVTLGPVNEGCLKGSDLYLQILDPGGVAIGGRQRVFPAVAAATSGSGDFHVAGLLSANELTSTGGATFEGGAVISGGGTRALDVNGHTETDSLRVLDDSNLGDVAAASLTVSGTLSASELELEDLAVLGKVSWDCPPDTWRVGNQCVTKNRGPVTANQLVSGTDAAADCHNHGMTLCPLETIYMCDELNIGNGTPQTCGTITDYTAPLPHPLWGILTNTPSTESGEGFERMCFWQTYIVLPISSQNYRQSCTAGHYYFCCAPVNPTTL